MNEENIKKHFSKKVFILVACFIICILILLFYFFFPRLNIDTVPSKIIVCQTNLKQLGLAFQIYAQANSNSYPIPDTWCDLIKPYLGSHTSEKDFQCPSAEKAICHYAMNPDCKPKSPSDTVLLFETKGGWNLFGSLELLTTENHLHNTCNVLFKNGSVKRIQKEEIGKLKWNTEEKK